jgi:hypothetical protein
MAAHAGQKSPAHLVKIDAHHPSAMRIVTDACKFTRQMMGKLPPAGWQTEIVHPPRHLMNP